jgi:hypothetical protein
MVVFLSVIYLIIPKIYFTTTKVAESHGNFRLDSKEINSDDDEDVYYPCAQNTHRSPKINVKKSRW